MTQLLQNSGGGTSIPYMFLPGNHEVRAHIKSVRGRALPAAIHVQSPVPGSGKLLPCQAHA